MNAAPRHPASIRLVLEEEGSGDLIGAMPLDEILSRVPEAMIVSAAALAGNPDAADRIEQIIATARDPQAPAALRGSNACGTMLLALCLRAVACGRGRRAVEPPRPDVTVIDTTAEEIVE